MKSDNQWNIAGPFFKISIFFFVVNWPLYIEEVPTYMLWAQSKAPVQGV
jgi:hypothetical protein